MKTLLFLTGFLFVLSSFADESRLGLEKSEVSNFSGSYELDRGNAKASVWQLAGETRVENINFEVFKENQQIRLVTPVEEYLFDEIPEFLLDLERMKWSGANASTQAQSVLLSLDELSGTGSGQSVNLKNLDGNCRGQSLQGDFFENLIEACTHSGNLYFSELTTSETLRRGQFSWYQFFENILKAPGPKDLGLKNSSVSLRDFNLKVRNKSFELNVKADLSISAKIKANGSFDYQQDRVRIRIDKVKASFLTITSKVFDELEKIQNQNIIVSRPYVTIIF